MRELPRALRWYLWAVYLVCALLVIVQAASVVGLLPHWREQFAALWAPAVFVLLAYASEHMMLDVSDTVLLSPVTATYVASILLFPPPAPLLIALLAGLTWQVIHARTPLYKRMFNICHSSVVVGLSSLLFSLVTTPGVVLRPTHIVEALPLFAMLLGLYYVLDVGVMIGLLALLERLSPWKVWMQMHRRTLLPELAASSIGILAAVAWLYQPVLLVLFIVPIAALRVALRAIAQAQRRGAGLEIVLTVGHHIQLQQSDAELLRPVVTAARTVAEAAIVTAYLRDDKRPDLLRHIAAPCDPSSTELPPSPIYPPAPARLSIPPSGRGIHEEPESGGLTLLVPLEQDDVGVIGLLRLTGLARRLTQDDRDVLSILATQATIALQNMRMHEQALARASEDGLTDLLNHRAFQTRLEEAVARARRDGRALALLMVDLDDFGTINNTYGHQAGDATLTAIAAALRETARATDIAARYGGDEFALILPETGMDEALDVAERVRAAIAGLRVVMASATVRVDASVGVAALPLHAATREELIQMADRASYAAKHRGKGRVGRPEDALLVSGHDPAALAAQLEHANMATVGALAAAVDAKDRYTRGHSQRVSTYAAAIAYALDLASTDVARVRLAGLLHDVGKIGVPDAILAKPTPLEPEEMAIIQQHPVIGEHMLAAVPFLREILPAVRSHHERQDGRGYPDGLAGDAIPRDAAILMVADSFDAMTSSRPYRPALPFDEACRRLHEGSGAQFDPVIVAAFEHALTEGTVRPQPLLHA